jgi:hypothetical protein
VVELTEEQRRALAKAEADIAHAKATGATTLVLDRLHALPAGIATLGQVDTVVLCLE